MHHLQAAIALDARFGFTPHEVGLKIIVAERFFCEKSVFPLGGGTKFPRSIFLTSSFGKRLKGSRKRHLCSVYYEPFLFCIKSSHLICLYSYVLQCMFLVTSFQPYVFLHCGVSCASKTRFSRHVHERVRHEVPVGRPHLLPLAEVPLSQERLGLLRRRGPRVSQSAAK